MPEKMECNAKELHTIEYISALDARLNNNEKHLENRLKSVPDLWRQYRIARTAIGKVINGLYDTVTPEAMAHMRNLAAHGEAVIRPVNSLNARTDCQILLRKDLDKLINITIGSTCSVCLKEGREIKKCELRKALLNICPPSIVSTDGLCVFTQVAANCEYGDYI
jgi:hypothetical protein